MKMWTLILFSLFLISHREEEQVKNNFPISYSRLPKVH